MKWFKFLKKFVVGVQDSIDTAVFWTKQGIYFMGINYLLKKGNVQKHFEIAGLIVVFNTILDKFGFNTLHFIKNFGNWNISHVNSNNELLENKIDIVTKEIDLIKDIILVHTLKKEIMIAEHVYMNYFIELEFGYLKSRYNVDEIDFELVDKHFIFPEKNENGNYNWFFPNYKVRVIFLDNVVFDDIRYEIGSVYEFDLKFFIYMYLAFAEEGQYIKFKFLGLISGVDDDLNPLFVLNSDKRDDDDNQGGSKTNKKEEILTKLVQQEGKSKEKTTSDQEKNNTNNQEDYLDVDTYSRLKNVLPTTLYNIEKTGDIDFSNWKVNTNLLNLMMKNVNSFLQKEDYLFRSSQIQDCNRFKKDIVLKDVKIKGNVDKKMKSIEKYNEKGQQKTQTAIRELTSTKEIKTNKKRIATVKLKKLSEEDRLVLPLGIFGTTSIVSSLGVIGSGLIAENSKEITSYSLGFVENSSSIVKYMPSIIKQVTSNKLKWQIVKFGFTAMAGIGFMGFLTVISKYAFNSFFKSPKNKFAIKQNTNKLKSIAFDKPKSKDFLNYLNLTKSYKLDKDGILTYYVFENGRSEQYKLDMNLQENRKLGFTIQNIYKNGGFRGLCKEQKSLLIMDGTDHDDDKNKYKELLNQDLKRMLSINSSKENDVNFGNVDKSNTFVDAIDKKPIDKIEPIIENIIEFVEN